eukprot:scaffold2609_cov123-Isochrysis_galbana.AAC.5
MRKPKRTPKVRLVDGVEGEGMHRKEDGDVFSDGGDEAAAERDSRSVYIGNVGFALCCVEGACGSALRPRYPVPTPVCLPSIQVDYSVTPEDLQEHFEPAGSVEKITIPTDKFKNPKGYAYIEFSDASAVEDAVGLSDTELKGRLIKVRLLAAGHPWLPSAQTYRGWAGAKAKADVAGRVADEVTAKSMARGRGGIARTTGRVMVGVATVLTEAEGGTPGELACTCMCCSCACRV